MWLLARSSRPSDALAGESLTCLHPEAQDPADPNLRTRRETRIIGSPRSAIRSIPALGTGRLQSRMVGLVALGPPNSTDKAKMVGMEDGTVAFAVLEAIASLTVFGAEGSAFDRRKSVP